MSIFTPKRKRQALAQVQFQNSLRQYQRSFPISKNPTVLSIIHSIASTVSTLNLDLYQRTKAGSYKAWNHPTSQLMEHPNLEDTATQFLYRMVVQYLSTGNVFILKANPYFLQLMDSRQVVVSRSSTAPYGKVYSYEGGPYTDNEVLHIYNPQYYDNYRGHSPIDFNSDIIELLNALLLYIGTYFGNSAGERLYVTLDNSTIQGLKDDTVKKEFEKWLQEKLLGPLLGGKPALLQPGMDLKNVKQTTNAESDLASLIERVEREVAKLFGYPYSLLAAEYGNNLQYQQIHYFQTCILPITEVFKESLNNLLPLKDRPFMSFEFGYENLIMPDVETRHKILREDIRGGLISINEGRRQIGMETYTGGSDLNVADTVWQLRNVAPVLEEFRDLYIQPTSAGNATDANTQTDSGSTN